MELDALKSVSTQNAAMQGYQPIKAEQGEYQAKKSFSKDDSSVAIDLPKTVAPSKNDRKFVKSTVKAGDDTNSSISNQNTEDAESKTDRTPNEVLDRAIEQVNQKLIDFKSECQFNVHKQTGLVSIKIINSETKELLKEIPPIKRLDAIAKMWELAGILIDEKR